MDASATPLANILHRGTLEALVGEKVFARGETYFRDGRVQKLERVKGVLTATVRGTTTYDVRIWASREGVAYKCQCPFGAEGLFCKHAVAVALAWVHAESTRDTAFQAQLRKLGQAELYAVVDAVAKTEAGTEAGHRGAHIPSWRVASFAENGSANLRIFAENNLPNLRMGQD